MRHLLPVILLLCSSVACSQEINITEAKFITGDDASWLTKDFNDAGWKTIRLNDNWENQGYEGYNGYAWYRIHFVLPSSLKVKSKLQEDLEFFLAKIDDADITYLNGVEIGRTGTIPEGGKEYVTEWNRDRHYIVKPNNPALRWDEENVLAIRVYDDNGGGGMFGGLPLIHFLQPYDYISMDILSSPFKLNGKTAGKAVVFHNSFSKEITGKLVASLELDDKQISKTEQKIVIGAGKSQTVNVTVPNAEAAAVRFIFTESQTGDQLQSSAELPYILTPQEKPAPQINNAAIFGCKTKAPFLLRIAATGTAPLQYAAENLPAGLQIDAATGIITGAVANEGSYAVTLKAKNKLGTAAKKITIVIGADKILLTPPMGWNSWNCWGLSVSDAKLRSSAEALIRSGLINHGFTYMNIDDGWEAPKRAVDGSIVTNEKFPDMKKLGDYLHGKGLKFGIYSSPGPTTCGGYLGSYQHVQQDADSYASWGIDYLKYDWCSYGNIVQQHPTLQELQQPYIEMHQAISKTGRNLVLSLCQYGMGNVWEWGNKVGGNLWRTTGDIEDSWPSLKNIAFRQDIPSAYNKSSYGFGDPDMLTVGFVGWGENLHQTKLSPSEQYTEISLWSLLSAPLLLGCDLARIDPFTYNLLSNDEVIAIDQDVAGNGAKKVVISNSLQVWIKELANGDKAIGIFNLGDKTLKENFALKQAGLNEKYAIRDVWRQVNMTAGNEVPLHIPAHGVLLLTIKKI